MNFQRYYIPGAAVFLTQVVEGRKPVFKDSQAIEWLLATLGTVDAIHPFNMLAFVFLPDHFHMIIQPTESDDFGRIMHSLKPNFVKLYKQKMEIPSSQALHFWQSRFWDHVIRDDKNFEDHLHYIHFNPVKHGLAQEPGAWQYSSFHEWQKRGLYSSNLQWKEPENNVWGE
jgi:putative transposase